MVAVCVLNAANPEWKCRVSSCNLHRRRGQKSGSAKKDRRRGFMFCSEHCGVRRMIPKKKYREVQTNDKLAVVVP